MKIIKRFFTTFVLISLMVINISPVAAIDDSSGYKTLRELVETGEVDLRELSMVEPYSLDQTVGAIVSIYSSSSGTSSSSTSGHSWLVIKGTKDTRTYGNYAVGPNKSITMGTWGNKGYNGIWYNLESSYRSSYSGTSTAYLKTAVTLDYINRFRNSLTSLNSWSATNNCSVFAVTAWNNTGGPIITRSAVETPTSLRNKIKSKTGYGTGNGDSDFVNASKSTRHY